MNLNESLRDWIFQQTPNYPTLDPVAIVTMGETETLDPPFLAIYETGVSEVESNGVAMHGVGAYEIVAELHTVPQDTDQEGTPVETERGWRRDFFEILGNRQAIDFCSGRNGWRIFDIRAVTPMTEPSEGRRITKIGLTGIACPI
jgi:hypothetical protein